MAMTPKASELEEIARRVEVIEEISVADVGVHLVAGVGIHLGALETCWPCSQFFLRFYLFHEPETSTELLSEKIVGVYRGRRLQ
jgi:hypothetical protein